MTEAELIRREIVHRLCAGDKSYSELTRNIPRALTQHAKFDEILKEVSVYQLPQGMEQGSYALKPACWQEYDRYFVHFGAKDSQVRLPRPSLQRPLTCVCTHTGGRGAPRPAAEGRPGRRRAAPAALGDQAAPAAPVRLSVGSR